MPKSLLFPQRPLEVIVETKRDTSYVNCKEAIAVAVSTKSFDGMLPYTSALLPVTQFSSTSWLFLMEQTGFILKVLVISAGVSILIKYGAPTLSIPATLTNVLLFVLGPTVVMAIALGIRYANSGAKR